MAAIIAISIKMVGLLLITGMLIIPAAWLEISRQSTKNGIVFNNWRFVISNYWFVFFTGV